MEPWKYDARDRATRPDLCPVFIEAPAGWLDELEYDCE